MRIGCGCNCYRKNLFGGMPFVWCWSRAVRASAPHSGYPCFGKDDCMNIEFLIHLKDSISRRISVGREASSSSEMDILGSAVLSGKTGASPDSEKPLRDSARGVVAGALSLSRIAPFLLDSSDPVLCFE
ncbi:hypothetical protein CDAR_463141 [Caerostris darwini]|uniref:Uncharacterized protein n=1 Tax=Caerostris darwini TaxID=1538125 RepID=A0AAV4QAU2_9ARAC|nr:hypothetical protein CDAR_463141 [Caerostris darwini]